MVGKGNGLIGWQTPYQTQFRERVHTLVYMGYARALPYIRLVHKEEDITGFIVREIKEILNTKAYPWCRQYAVRENNPVEGGGRKGRSRKKPDIIIESVTRTRRPEYVFEAKRLDDNSNKEKTYVGVDGMGCFIQENYASEYPEAIMLGYVQCDTIPTWALRIIAAIETDHLNNLRFKPPIRHVKIINEITEEIVSTHIRSNKGRIDIYHIFLDCCS